METSLYTYQIVAIVGNIFLLFFLIDLVRRKKIKDHYSILWFLIFIIFLILSFSPRLVLWIASFLSIEYPPSGLFLILIISLFLLSIHFSIVLSGMDEKQKKLSQTLGLMDIEIKKLKREKKENKK